MHEIARGNAVLLVVQCYYPFGPCWLRLVRVKLICVLVIRGEILSTDSHAKIKPILSVKICFIFFWGYVTGWKGGMRSGAGEILRVVWRYG